MAALAVSVVAAALASWWYVSGGPEATLRGHEGPIYTLAFSSDGEALASGGADGVVRLWDLRVLTQRAALSGHAGFIMSVAFSPDGKTLATRDDHEVRLWDVAAGGSRAILPGGEMPEWAVRDRLVSPDGRLRLGTESSPRSRTLTLCDATTGRRLVALEGHPDQLNDWAFHPGGELLATGGGFTDHPWPVNKAGDVRVWDVGTGRILAKFGGHWGAVARVAFSPDGRRLASAGYDGTIKVWDVSRLSER